MPIKYILKSGYQMQCRSDALLCCSVTLTGLLHVTENGTTINYLTQKGWTVMKYNQVNDGAFMLGLSHITTTHPD